MGKKVYAVLKNGAAPMALALTLAATPAWAQGNPADADGGDIIVTGSRIARPELSASIPVAVVSAETIQNKGQTNVLDALRDIPVAGQSLDKSASNFSNFDNGISTINLRNLGTSRTLVLINGRRSVGTPGDSAVDLNNDRAVDIITSTNRGTFIFWGQR